MRSNPVAVTQDECNRTRETNRKFREEIKTRELRHIQELRDKQDTEYISGHGQVFKLGSSGCIKTQPDWSELDNDTVSYLQENNIQATELYNFGQICAAVSKIVPKCRDCSKNWSVIYDIVSGNLYWSLECPKCGFQPHMKNSSLHFFYSEDFESASEFEFSLLRSLFDRRYRSIEPSYKCSMSVVKPRVNPFKQVEDALGRWSTRNIAQWSGG